MLGWRLASVRWVGASLRAIHSGVVARYQSQHTKSTRGGVFCQSAIENAQKDHAAVVQNILDNKDTGFEPRQWFMSVSEKTTSGLANGVFPRTYHVPFLGFHVSGTVCSNQILHANAAILKNECEG